MGVEEVYIDEFTRAKEYKAARAVKGNNVRRDLELDALPRFWIISVSLPATLMYNQRLTC
jgi:hypothetical protein